MLTDSIVESIEYDAKSRRASGVRLLDARTGARSVQRSRIVFLCTGSINSVSVLLRSVAEASPQGLGNSSGLLGRYIMDHTFGGLAFASVPGIDDQMYRGRKPNGILIPRFVNMDKQETDFLRGYSYQGMGLREFGILPHGLANRMNDIVNVRHRVVHGYSSVDFARFWREIPNGIAALEDLSTAIATFAGRLP